MRRAAKVDLNQAEIVSALRAVHAEVEPLHFVGHGVPDLLVSYQGQNFLLEVKHGNGDLTPDQKVWHRKWVGQVDVVRTPAEALAVIGAIFSDAEHPS